MRYLLYSSTLLRCVLTGTLTFQQTEHRMISAPVFTFESIRLVTRYDFGRTAVNASLAPSGFAYSLRGVCVYVCVLPARERERVPGTKSCALHTCIPLRSLFTCLLQRCAMHVSIMVNLYWLLLTFLYIPASPGCSTEAEM